MIESIDLIDLGELTLESRQGELWARRGADERTLGEPLLCAVLGRYGRPLEPRFHAPAADAAVLTLASGARLWILAYRSPFDVIANDHLVLALPVAEPVAAPAPLVAAALAHLLR